MKPGSKTKLYKNNNRNKNENVQKYVPQYQVLGLEPTEYKSAVVPSNLPKVNTSTVNPREKRIPIRQPYATTVQNTIGSGSNVLPNVGNNVEQTWSSVDGEIVDDLNIDPNHEMVDNNEFVHKSSDNFAPSFQTSVDNFELAPSNELLDVLQDLEETSYLLLVEGIPICSGPKNDIEDQVQALISGEHDLCDGNEVDAQDIMVFKKLSIKRVAIID